MKRQQGFTLIELLVVVAIIGILAGIIIPNVIGYMSRARMTRATAEIKGIDLALTKMLTDVGRQDFRRGFFATDVPNFELTEMATAVELYTNVFYVLLKQGKNADLTPYDVELNAEVRNKLGTGYMTDLGKDPWGNLYHFFPGPWRSSELCPFLVRQADTDIPGGYMNALTPSTGNGSLYARVEFTNADGDTLLLGWPAPRDLPMYIYSNGANLLSNQSFDTGFDLTSVDDDAYVGDDYIAGGDDVNNWDTTNSWASFY